MDCNFHPSLNIGTDASNQIENKIKVLHLIFVIKSYY